MKINKKGRLEIILIKYWGREKEGPSTIDFKVYAYTFFLIVIFLIRVG